ncbi:MAG: hypothetical protein ACTSUE_08585 [Promethearchaeota archaeon]
MAAGDVLPSEKRLAQALTLHDDFPVYQVTSRGTRNFCQYFTHSSWRSDAMELVFTSDRSGSMEFYSVRPETGEITQLSEGANASTFGWAIAADGSFLVYYGGGVEAGAQEEIHRLWLKTLEDELVLTRPERYRGWTRSIISLAPDKDTFYVDGTANPRQYVPSNLFRASIKEGTFEPVFADGDEKSNFFCHNMLDPSDPSILQVNKAPVEYVGRDAPQRMWLLNTVTGELNPLYKHGTSIFGKFERVGHECWHPSGKYMVFVVRRNKVRACVVDEGFGNKQAWTCGKGPNFWHVSASPRGGLLCADTMWTDTGLWLIEFKPSEMGRLRNICLSDSKWQSREAKELDARTPEPLHAHPHPGWSPDGNYINFTSFRPRQKAVHLYLVKIPPNPVFD